MLESHLVPQLELDLEQEQVSEQTKPTKSTPMLESYIIPKQALGVEWALDSELDPKPTNPTAMLESHIMPQQALELEWALD